MVIYTYGHEYPVSSVQSANGIYDCYICREPEKGGFCRILSIKERSLFPDVVNWLSASVDPSVFTDYIEHFIYNGTFCIVMKYTQGETLADKLETESFPLMEKLELFRKILERAVLQDIPGYFLYKCLDLNNIIVSPDLTVEFNYPIDDIIVTRDGDHMRKLDTLARTVFAEEIERNVPDELMEFFAELPGLLDGTLIDLYSRYYMMICRVVEKEAHTEEPKSFWFKLWDKIKKIWAVLKRILMFVLLAAALVYLIFTIGGGGKKQTKTANFTSIGTVEIDKDR